MTDYTLHCGDCLDIMPTLEAESIDAIIADVPYGTTSCAWDSVIPFAPMWECIKYLIKPRGAVLLFGSEPFSSMLRLSNMDWYKYDWVWRKSKPNGWQHAKNKPMKADEDVIVFSSAPMGHASLLGDRRMTYYPQGVRHNGVNVITDKNHGRTMGARPNQVGKVYEAFTGFPSNILDFPNIFGSNAIHPTQKPVDLMAYLIRTYTNPGETVLDFTMGSGSTGVAAIHEGRRFVGIEKDTGYFEIAQRRISEATQQPALLEVA